MLTVGLLIISLGVFISGVGYIDKLKKYDLYKIHLNTPFFYSLIGYLIFGFGAGFVTIPVLPEIMEGIEEKFENDFDHKKFVDSLSGYFIVS